MMCDFGGGDDDDDDDDDDDGACRSHALAYVRWLQRPASSSTYRCKRNPVRAPSCIPARLHTAPPNL